MLLTLFSIEKAKPQEKPYKLSDGHGLYLLAKPNGSKLWRFRYHFAGKQNMMSFGSFPETSLASARAKRSQDHLGCVPAASHEPPRKEYRADQPREVERSKLQHSVRIQQATYAACFSCVSGQASTSTVT
ncbi:MAG: Arm DNA-binding domain-containing protein [Xanthobacteraceae bacterium]|nr:Arm DNA-binding domain-containing protein [Xanthobacteraceae bacterium]